MPASRSTDFANFCEDIGDAQRATTGLAIARPGTAKGFVFLSIEDETGIFNVIIDPKTFARCKLLALTEPFLLIDGALENVDGVVSVKAARIAALPDGAAAEVHNFR